MPKQLHTVLVDAADRREARFRRAFIKSSKQLQADFPLEEMTRILETGSLQKAIAFVDAMDLETVLGPVVGITKDTFVKGGKEGAKVL
jgi:hypothetical protein